MYFFEDMLKAVGRRLDEAASALGGLFAGRSVYPSLLSRTREFARDSISRAGESLTSVRTRMWLMRAAPFAKPAIAFALLASAAVVLPFMLAPPEDPPDPRHAQLDSAARSRVGAINAEIAARQLAQRSKKPVKTFEPATRPAGDLFGKPRK